jgi:hypothetical protein
MLDLYHDWCEETNKLLSKWVLHEECQCLLMEMIYLPGRDELVSTTRKP